jgi:molybdopterin converting factor subunit 1
MHVACKMQNKVQGNRLFNVSSLSHCTEFYFRCRDVRTLMERINVNVLFFAKAREIVGRHSSTLTLDLKSNTTTGDQILRLILEQVPGLANISESIVLAVDQEYTSPDQTIVLKEGSEIALIPPLSGG